jgi:hypothetical protein
LFNKRNSNKLRSNAKKWKSGYLFDTCFLIHNSQIEESRISIYFLKNRGTAEKKLWQPENESFEHLNASSMRRSDVETLSFANNKTFH